MIKDSERASFKAGANSPPTPSKNRDEPARGVPFVEQPRNLERGADKALQRDQRSNAAAEQNDDQAQKQRASSAPYAKEDHMNQELAKQVEAGQQNNSLSE